ncbi:MAG: HTH-type sugar sensing transcriptional regulator TrmBL1 [Methanonatronarchaeales archaeon]|nr:HTH-type sugar sensing transcriptional regulator TrmBL1 [Methanonatronarchaeales archaeon]
MRRLIEKLGALGLTEYEAKAFAHLYSAGELKASDVAELSGVPRPKVYGALSTLVELGLVEKIPGRPTLYRTKSAGEVRGTLERRVREEFEDSLAHVNDARNELRKMERSMREKRRELLHIVGVGEPSLNETRGLYREAEAEIAVVSKAMEYLGEVEEELAEAAERGVSVRALMLNPESLSKNSARVQGNSSEALGELGAEVRYSTAPLPLRGSVVDASMDYESGAAIFVVEERGVPLRLRDAAVTRNPSLVAGMKRYLDMVWEHESRAAPRGRRGKGT